MKLRKQSKNENPTDRYRHHLGNNRGYICVRHVRGRGKNTTRTRRRKMITIKCEMCADSCIEIPETIYIKFGWYIKRVGWKIWEYSPKKKFIVCPYCFDNIIKKAEPQ